VILKIILKHLKESSLDNKRIHKHKIITLLRYARTLYFLPVFDMERPIDLNNYEGKTLGAITSPDNRHVKYKTTDRFLRELTSLEIGNNMSYSLLGCYYKTFYGITGMPLYVDGHFKAVWTLKNIPKGKHGMMDRIMPGLKQIFLNGHNGHPLLHRTCPGDRHLTKEILPIIKDFENFIGSEVVNLVVFDGEGCSLEVFRDFDNFNKNRENKIYPLTVLDSNQYQLKDFKIKDGNCRRPLKNGDFEVYKRDKKGRVITRVALVEFDYLNNTNKKPKDVEEYLMRCALVKKENGKFTAIITTLTSEAILSGTELANLYYNRWPCQEAKFKEMTRYCNLNINHGFKKKKVFNRMADRRLKKTEKSLAYDKRRLEHLMEKYAHVKRQMEKRNSRFEKELEKLGDQIEKINCRLENHKGDENKLMKRLEKKNRGIGQLEGLYQDKIRVLKEREKELIKQEKQILKSIDQNKLDVVNWKKELKDTPFYEIDSEMDHIMTNFKILLENSLLFVKDTFFEGKMGLGMLIKQFINHYGDLQILGGGNKFKFIMNKFDGKGLTKKAKNACTIFNEMKIKTADGTILEITIKR
jgi:hypothetical protein